jgi:hypothetical protein
VLVKNPRSRLVSAVSAALLTVTASLALALPSSAADSASPSPSAGATGATGATSADPAVVTFGIGPSTKGKLDRRPNFTLLAPRGGVVSDQVALVNLTKQPLTLNLYAADALNTADGTLALQPAAAPLADSAAWVTFKTPSGKGYVVLPPNDGIGTPTFINFTVKIPKDAYVGDHLAGVIASTVSEGAAPGDRAAQVKFEQRIGLRLGIRVAGELKPQLSVENVSAAYSSSLNPFGRGSAVVTYTVRNTGNVRLGGKQTVTVNGIVGPVATGGTLPDVPLLLPGGSASVTVTVPDVVPLGLVTATVSIDPVGALGDANPPAAVAVGTTRFVAVPWTLLALLLLLLLLGGAFLRRRRAPRAPSAVGDTRAVSGPDLVTTSRHGSGQ